MEVPRFGVCRMMIVDGYIQGYMHIDGMINLTYFSVCAVEDFEKMNEDEKETALTEAKNESGLFDYGYAE